MLRKSDLFPYLVFSIAIHLIVPFIVFQTKEKPVFMSAPIDVSFYSPAEQRADPPPVAAIEEPSEPEPVKEEVKETPKTKEDIVVKEKEKPKPKPKPKKPKPEPKPKTEAPKKDVLPSANPNNVQTLQSSAEPRYAVSGAQFEGLAFDTASFKYAYYTNTIVRSIGRHWQWSESYGRLRAVVYFKILRDGSITSIVVKESSGDTSFDKNAERAVQLASPFAPLPEGYKGDSLGVYFEFKYRN